jgi:hypothetical protein
VKKEGSNEKSFKNNFLERGQVRDERCTPLCKDTIKKDSSEVTCYSSTFKSSAVLPGRYAALVDNF